MAEGARQPPVVFLHGWGLGPWRLGGCRPSGAAAGAGRTCLAPDLPGHGPAERGRARHEPQAYADLVDQVAARLPAGELDLVGYSLGAKLSLMLAAATPGRVRRLAAVAVGDNLFAAEGSGAAMSQALEQGLTAETPARIARMAVHALQSGGDPRALAACLRRPWRPPSEADLAAIRSQTLLVLAAQDELVTSSGRLEAALPNAQVRHLAGYDHLSALYAAELRVLIGDFLA